MATITNNTSTPVTIINRAGVQLTIAANSNITVNNVDLLYANFAKAQFEGYITVSGWSDPTVGTGGGGGGSQIGVLPNALGQTNMANSSPVVIASDQSAVPISSSALTTIATNTPAVGQATMSASTPVVIASNQSAISVTDTRLPTALGSAAAASSLPVVVATGGTAVVGGIIGLTTAGTAQQVTSTSNALLNGVILKASPSNTGVITIGGSAVNNTLTSGGTGFPLKPGEAISWAGSNTNAIYFNGTVTGDLLYFLGN